MTNSDALLASIFADPDEDTPRLVYADWLDENGQSAWQHCNRFGTAVRNTL